MALTTAQIQNAYVAFFNRPADVAGLTYWSTYAGSTADLLNTFAQSTEYKNLYSGLNNTQIVNAVYSNLFGHTPDVAGLTYWVTQLDQGKLAIGNIADAINKGAQGTDATIIANKTTAATEFTKALDTTAEIVAYAGVNSTGLDAVKAWLAAVTSDSATLTNATSTATLTSITTTVLNNVASTGSTFTLTSGVDTLNGTIGNDTFVADNSNTAVTSAADSINGGAGFDTLKVYAKAGAQVVLPTLTSVEALYLNGDNTGLDVSNVAGLTSLTLDGGSTATYTLAGQAVTIQNQTAAAAYTLDSTSDTTENITVSKIGAASSNTQGTIALTGTKVASATITSTGSATNVVTLTNTGGALTSLTLKGDQALNLTSTLTTIATVDASAATGNVKVDLGGAASLPASFKFTGGTGNDTLDIHGTATAAALNAYAIDGGAGNDTVILNNAVATGTTAITSLKNVEVIGDFNATGTVNMANFAGATGFLLSGQNAGAVTVNGLASTATLDYGTVDLNNKAVVVNAAGTGSSDAVTWTLGNAVTSTAISSTGGNAANTINGYETVNLTSQGAANTLGNVTLGASAGGSETLNVTLTKGLTVGALSLSGAATKVALAGSGDFTATSIVAGTVASTATGAVTVASASNVLSADFTSTTKAVTFNDANASAAASLKFGTGNITVTGGAGADIISVGSGTNSITGGAGADQITINHGSLANVDTLVIGATGQTGAGIVANGALSGVDVVTGAAKGDVIDISAIASTLVSVTRETAFTGTETAGTGTAAFLVTGTYDANAGTFTASSTGNDSVFMYDNNGSTAAGSMEAIVLVGYHGTSATAVAGVITLG